MFSSSKCWFILLILLFASLTHWLKLVVLSLHYLHMMKTCCNPLVSHLWDRSARWRLLDLIKGIFNNAICFTLFTTTMMTPRKKIVMKVCISDMLAFHLLCSLLLCVWENLPAQQAWRQSLCCGTLPCKKELARHYHTPFFIRLTFNALENTIFGSVNWHAELFFHGSRLNSVFIYQYEFLKLSYSWLLVVYTWAWKLANI